MHTPHEWGAVGQDANDEEDTQVPTSGEEASLQLSPHLPDIPHRSKTPACIVRISTVLLSWKTEEGIVAVRGETQRTRGQTVTGAICGSQGSPYLTPHQGTYSKRVHTTIGP